MLDKKSRAGIITTGLTAVAIMAGCVGKDRGEKPIDASDVSVALEQSVDQSIIPAVQAFKLETATLEQNAEAFCSTPSEQQLSALQSSWRITFEQWYALSIFNFGPLDDDIVFPAYTFIDGLRLRGTNYLATVRSEIAEDIAGSQTLDSNYFAGKTFQNVGLLALEVAMFETTTSDYSAATADILADYQNNPRKCDVLLGLANQLLRWANYIEEGWLTEYKNTTEPYRSLFLNAELDDGSEPITQLIVAVQEFLDYLQARNVVNVTAPLAANSWAAMSATIDEVERLLQGTDQTTISLFDIMVATGNQNAVATVQGNIAQIRSAIGDQDADMLEITLGYLDGNFKREIPDSLDVELGINFSDGD